MATYSTKVNLHDNSTISSNYVVSQLTRHKSSTQGAGENRVTPCSYKVDSKAGRVTTPSHKVYNKGVRVE